MSIKKCDPRVYAKCPEKSLCGDFASASFVAGSPCDLYNERMLAAPMTNADRIRAMSDEELARFLAEVENRRSAAGGGAIWKGAAHAKEWLKQPAKEDA